MTEEKRNNQIAETNQRILGCCTELIRKLDQDPEAQISDVISHMHNVSTSRSTQIREKYRCARNICDRYERRPENALD